MLIFLQRLRRKTTFQELGYLYGCGKESARRYFGEMVKIFHTHFVPRLVFPRTPEELRKMSREQVLKQFPDLLAIFGCNKLGAVEAGKFSRESVVLLCFQAHERFPSSFG